MEILSDHDRGTGPAGDDPGQRRTRRRRGETALILEEEPDLARGLSPQDTRAAVAAFRASVISVKHRRWEPPRLDPATAYGLLVLEGLIGRRVRIGPAVGTELLSCGDILRPWDEPLRWNLIPPELDWRVFRPVRLAVLDEPITRLIGSRPQLVVNFSGRLVRRTRSVAYIMAVSHQPRVADKLLLTLWHLASSFGRVTSDGVKIPFKLTHEVLGEIIGAQRPSVTTAMRALQTSGQLKRVPGEGLVLLADPEDWARTARRAVSGMAAPEPATLAGSLPVGPPGDLA
ncbi:MAG TPA: helix-turn-helix domain-containing protein [Solirubrobacteraceae bacterium]|nr:helix-turn-helix domain-containing protein [Solirubrobacteraceae bacterium]